MAKLTKRKKVMLDNISRSLDKLIKKSESTGVTLDEALNEIKKTIERSIEKFGEQGKHNLIRSQKPIKLLHEVIKSSLVQQGIKSDRIKPGLGESNGELKLAGLIKRKDQDICVLPRDIEPNTESLTSGIMKGEDIYGKEYTERVISINVRSQLSSLGNNIDTLYERTFAEALNLHMRCPSMCLGEVYMIPIYEYDKYKAQKKQIAFTKKKTNVEDYIKGFEFLNKRNSTTSDHYKYEKVCLLVVDFSKSPPKVYDNDKDLKSDGIINSKSDVSIKDLTFNDFTKTLIKVYKSRFTS